MRLASLTLERYGPFERLRLALDPAPGRVNLLLAPNGFGKSVIRAAIGDLLFGIPERTDMDFRYGTERMRLLADIVTAGGVRSLVRRKGRGNTLLADGATVPPEQLPRLFGDADATVFRELFGLDTELLRRGGKELIHSQGRLGQVLFAAGGGMGRVRDLLAKLQQQRDDFGSASRQHKSRPLWGAKMAAEQAKLDLKHASLRADRWERLEQDAQQAAAQLGALFAERAACMAEIERLRLTVAIRPWLGRLEQARESLAAAVGAPEFDAGFEPRWRAALAAGAQSASMAEAAEAALATARQARDGIGFDAAWLAAGDRIEALAEVRGRAQGAATDLPPLQSELAGLRARCGQLRRDLDLDPAATLPPAPVTRDAQRRLREYPALAAAVASAEQARTDAADLLARIRRELAELPDDTDAAALADLGTLLRAGGDPAARHEAAHRRLRDAELALATALAAIPDRALPEAALAMTAAPSDPALDAADTALGSASATYVQAAEARSACLAETATVTSELAALVRLARLPEPDALAQVRAVRDALWRQLCAPQPPAPDPAAAVTLDRAMRDADAVADALIEHGQEMAQAAALRDRLATLAQLQEAAERRLAAAAGTLAAARAALAGLAAIAGSEAPDAASLRAFLRARATAVARAIERDAAAREAADIDTALAALGGSLARVMAVPPPTMEALGALLAEADRRILASRSLVERRAGLARQAADQQATLDRYVSTAGRMTEQLAQWRREWAAASVALGRPAAEPPAATAEALPLIETLRTTEATRDEAGRRVDDMQAAAALLAQLVAEVTDLAPELRPLPPVAAAAALEQRLQNERLRHALCESADQRIVAATEALALAQAGAAAAAQDLAGLRAALLADSDAAAELQLQRSRVATQARRDHAEAERELARAGGGVAVEALAARAAATTADADEADIQAAAARQDLLAAEIELAREARDRAAAARDQAALSSDPAEAALRREAARATLARIAEEALVLHAAHALLQAALDRQAAGADQPLLARIGAIFRDITGGAYAGVAIEDAKAGQVMTALEADGLARKPLDQLSEGTGDQLYLALRIAALEDYAAAGEPLPFIADDVLQTFDDPRTTATLHALLRLSAHVQVIALTHHSHVGALANALPPGAMHVVQLTQ